MYVITMIDLENTLNTKFILCISEQLSELKINFHKIVVFCFSKTKEVEDQYIDLLSCEAGSFPFRYLGIPSSLS
jgi:hypothetical protein